MGLQAEEKNKKDKKSRLSNAIKQSERQRTPSKISLIPYPWDEQEESKNE